LLKWGEKRFSEMNAWMRIRVSVESIGKSSTESPNTLQCERAGTVFFLTPMLERNRDTVAQPLMDQGFEKVALPEVQLFNSTSSANFCTLFQKDCSVGETILIGRWAVPVFFP
jgi:hypothetical protein